MLHPNQFDVNEAWMVFKLNDAPIRTASEGDFNCIALMDAASCFILTAEAERQGITVVRVPEDQLRLFIDEARESFRESFGGGGTH